MSQAMRTSAKLARSLSSSPMQPATKMQVSKEKKKHKIKQQQHTSHHPSTSAQS